MAERDLKNRESKKRKNALPLKRARDAARRRSAELIHDSRPNPKKRMHAGRFRSLPILEPSQGVNTTAFTTYSRDYFPPRGKRLSVQLAFSVLSRSTCAAARSALWRLHKPLDFSAPVRHATQRRCTSVCDEEQNDLDADCQPTRKPPNIAKDALLSLHG